MNLVIFLRNFDVFLSEFHGYSQKMMKRLEILIKSAPKTRKKAENSGIGAKFYSFISFFQSHPYFSWLARGRANVYAPLARQKPAPLHEPCFKLPQLVVDVKPPASVCKLSVPSCTGWGIFSAVTLPTRSAFWFLNQTPPFSRIDWIAIQRPKRHSFHPWVCEIWWNGQKSQFRYTAGAIDSK